MSAPLYVCLDTVPTALTGCGSYIYDSDKTLWFGVRKMYVKLTSVTFNGNLAHQIESFQNPVDLFSIFFFIR